ncbi:RnaseH [uncultured Caudovirales phage]|uniref:RnaseH n=1 Tax=uncultured Caudovirales phage TaxID=2100421 RepID=A0A6J5Q6X1_9CAUD|nr:RnaseH [uncultured Caudovirales phage]CAB4177075.1 RnaseH [uncultured Caudovirales phage]CAB4182278.1 RnaseH [uncultured Caudovirales phage]CAB4190826.1 RnaseH [uncultured Caudovirales phage]CAB4211175.1 RnaseH [uncultured Caudovirales phage]
MILIDLNQVLISNLMQQINSNPKMKLDEPLIRHMVLNSLRSYAKQFKSKYGDIVVACDSKKYWRRDIFPFYKAHRKSDREKSEFDWHLIFQTLNKIRDELKENFPYKVIEVDGAEADDVIGVLTARLAAHEEILILSSDKDFVQLQKYPGVVQYSPILKRFVKTEDPLNYIKEHIIRGDRGDGIPNFLSPDNTFVAGERQKVISTKKLQEWINSTAEEFCTTDMMLRGYKRNQMLVDLDYIPETLKEQIVRAYDVPKSGSRQKMLNYFIDNRLKNLIECIDEF